MTHSVRRAADRTERRIGMRIGVVLAGGFAKGAYQIGAMRAIEEYIPRGDIKYMSCASIGALNGYAYVTDNLDRVTQMWENIASGDTRMFITKIMRSSLLQQNITALYAPDKPLTRPFYLSLFDVSHRSVVYQDLAKVEGEKIPQYLKAGIALPPINRSVKLGAMNCYDGGLIDNIPVYPLLKHSVDYVICIYFDDIYFKFENTYFDNKILKIAFPSDSMIKHSFMVTHDRIDEMIEEGYKQTKYIFKSAFAKGYDDLDHVYHTIDYMNKHAKSQGLRLTTDTVITNLNKATQLLTKRKIL